LSLAIEESKFSDVKKMYPLISNRSDVESLIQIALDMTNDDVQKRYDISKKVALGIYSEARDKLSGMGTDISKVIDAFNFS